MNSKYSLTDDPLYYVTIGFFAFFTTGLSAILGQVRFMPLLQALCLTVFLASAIRRGRTNHALLAIGVWLVIQILTITLMTWLAADRVDRAIADGFLLRATYAEWFFAGSPLPGAMSADPGRRLFEVAGVWLGSLLSGGLIGAWFLVRAANMAGFLAGGLILVFDSPLAPIAAFPLWTILRLAGYAGLLVLTGRADADRQLVADPLLDPAP
ncbi:MAG: hypothetical protein HC802_06590 [Caldilineaceae bacterium]|nr:hypothetical protein [Caldilineaceae bacterium]